MRRIRTKFLLYTLGLVVFAVIGFSVVSTYLERMRFVESLLADSVRVVATIAGAVANDLHSLDIYRLRNYVDSARINKDIKTLYILDTQGLVVTNGTKADDAFDKPLDDPFVRSLLQAGPTKPMLQLDDVLRAGLPIIMADGTVLGYVYVVFTLDRLNTRLDERISETGLIALGLLMVSGSCALYCAWRFTRPILELVDTAKRIGEGDLSFHANIHGNDEIALLGRTINNMAESLSIQIGKISEAQENLKEAKLQADRANAAKSEFLAHMSHELRTPLNAIIGFSEIIWKLMLGAQAMTKYQEYGNLIHAAGTHLLAVINDILDLSRIEAGKLDLADGIIDVGDLLDDCVEIMHQRAVANNVSLEHQVHGQLLPLKCDARRMRQVLLNLVSNAIKFTPDGGRVSLSAHQMQGSWLAIKVIDTGIGIAQEDIVNVMQPFRQIDSTLSRRHQGTGLGLPLAKTLVEAHGGSLAVESIVGVGTTVTVRMPVDRLARATA